MQKVITPHCMCTDSYQLKMATQLEQSSKGKETIQFLNAKGAYSRNSLASRSLEKQYDWPAVCVAERCAHFKTGKFVTWNGRRDHSEFRMPQSASMKGATNYRMTTKCKEYHLPSFLQHYATSGHKLLNHIAWIHHHTAGMKHPGFHY